jgi:phosphatidylinositol alpha-mannosyltransferase
LEDHGVSLIDAGRVVRIPANGSVAPISLNPRAAIKVRRHFLQWRADVIHCHEPLAPLLSYALVVAPPAPLVATYHRAGGGPFMGLLKPIRPLFGRRISQSFAVSNAAKEFAAKVTTANPTVLFNGIDLSAVDRATPRDLGVSAVVFIGRHEERKGLQVLLEAHEMLGSGVLSIAGAGPQTDDLRERFPESSSRHWLGVVSDDEKYALLRGAAVTCAPALGGESFGIIVLEALAASR